MLKKTIYGVMCGAMAAGLVACGGGGGGGGGDEVDRPTGDLTAQNYAATSDEAHASLNGSAAMSMLAYAASPAAVGGAQERDKGTGVLALQRKVTDALTRRVARETPQGQSTYYDDSYCDTGRLVIVNEYASETDYVVGDRTVVTSDNCVVDGQAITGSVSGTLNRFSEGSNSLDARVTVSFANFGVPGEQVDGSASVEVRYTDDTSRFSVAYNNLTVRLNGESSTWNHRVTVSYVESNSTTTLEFDGLVSVDGSSYKVTQGAAFTFSGASTEPAGGWVRLTDAQGDRVDLVAQGSGMVYNFYTAGNQTGTPDASIVREGPL